LTARLDEVAPEGWDERLERLGLADVYLRRTYVEASSLLDAGRPTLLHLEGGDGSVVFACIVREIAEEPGRRDVTTPYGYGGPVAAGAEPPLADFAAAYDAWCEEQGAVTTFVRFHPLFGNQDYAPPAFALDRIGDTLAWRLEGDLLARMHPKHRNVVRKAASAGLEVFVHEAPGDLAAFASLYEDTMRRRGAHDYYLFASAYWERLTTELRDAVVRVDATHDGELLASALCLANPAKPRWLHYHLAATSELARTTGASNLVLFEAARWAQGRGFTAFHLGGGVGGREDSLFTFKLRFDPSGRRQNFLGKAVHDPAAYRELAGGTAVDGFFPAYRAPRAAAAE
jgi:serine/alanine adding enzyme